MNDKNIALIYTGGTIGMLPSAQGLRVDGDFPARLARALGQADVPIFSLNPLIDSASATPVHWQAIADSVVAHQAHYDGFVILHGTDTLAYSAAALSMMLQGFAKPVVLTGAQYPLGATQSDALNNVRGAMAAAQDARSRVSVFFYDRLLDAARVRKRHAQSPQAFVGVNSEDWACWHDDALHWTVNSPAPAPQSAYLRGQWRGFQLGAVAMLWVTPDMPVSAFRPLLSDPLIQGVVLVSFGSGNLPERADLHHAIGAAVARGVRIINVTQCCAGTVAQDTYAAGAASLGIDSGNDLTPEAAFVRLHIDLASGATQS